MKVQVPDSPCVLTTPQASHPSGAASDHDDSLIVRRFAVGKTQHEVGRARRISALGQQPVREDLRLSPTAMASLHIGDTVAEGHERVTPGEIEFMGFVQVGVCQIEQGTGW